MAFNVTYSFNSGAVTGTATSISALRQAIYNYAHSGSISDDTGSDYHYLTQCTLSGTAEGKLSIGNENGTNTTSEYFGVLQNCSSLTNVDLSGLDTSNVTSMYGMFQKCSSLTTLDLSSFNTSNVTVMSYMLRDCSSLTTVDLSSFNTSSANNMTCMFYNCSSLTNLDLSNFDTSNVDNMNNMFQGCSSLTTVDLSSFDTSKVTKMASMFYNCSSLTSIKIKSKLWKTNLVTSSANMFKSCTYLPNFNSATINASMAKPTWQGGYLEDIEPPTYKIQQYIKLNGQVFKAYPNVNIPNIITLTQAEYDAITTKDANTIYLIKES